MNSAIPHLKDYFSSLSIYGYIPYNDNSYYSISVFVKSVYVARNMELIRFQ